MFWSVVEKILGDGGGGKLGRPSSQEGQEGRNSGRSRYGDIFLGVRCVGKLGGGGGCGGPENWGDGEGDGDTPPPPGL